MSNFEKFKDIAGSVFEKNRATAIVKELAAAMRPMSQLDGYLPDYAANKIIDQLQKRLETMMTRAQQYAPMALSGVYKSSVTLSADVEGAHIFINGINVPYASFDGVLFSPITLEAKAPAGYTFAGWKASSGSVLTDSVINLPERSKFSFVASFTPISDSDREANGFTPVCINEVSAANNIYVNEYFKRNDWVDLYNTTDADIDVEGMYLSDKPDNPKKYQIVGGEASTIIPAHGYLIVWCDKLEPLSQLHTAFKLDADGGDVILTAEDESWSNRLTYAAMKADETAGRYPDGTSNVFTMNVPTIAKTNIISSYATAVEQPTETAVPNLMAEAGDLGIRYVVGRLLINGTPTESLQIRVVNLAGQLALSLPTSLNGGYAEVSIEQLPAGVYIAHATDDQGHQATCKFVKR